MYLEKNKTSIGLKICRYFKLSLRLILNGSFKFSHNNHSLSFIYSNIHTSQSVNKDRAANSSDEFGFIFGKRSILVLYFWLTIIKRKDTVC